MNNWSIERSDEALIAWGLKRGLEIAQTGYPWRLFTPKLNPPGVSQGWNRSSRWEDDLWADYFPKEQTWRDHEYIWKRIAAPKQVVCVTTHPYRGNLGDTFDRNRENLEVLGAKIFLHQPDSRRSWYYPGSAYMIEIWRPGYPAMPSTEVYG